MSGPFRLLTAPEKERSAERRGFLVKINRESAFSVFLVALLSWTGCAATSPGRGDGDVLDLGALARDFWQVREPVELGQIESPRVAVVEFTVEYVLASETGETRKLDFGTGMKIELPGVLYMGFVDALPTYDRHSVPIQAVSEAAAYQRLEGTGIEDVPLLPESVKETTRYPVDGLLCLAGHQDQTDAVIADLLDEVEADYALQVRLRVSIRNGRASIEKGSTVRVVTRDGTGLIETRRALVSAQSVTEEEPDSDVTAINSQRFVRAIQRLFRPCIGMALITTGREV